jgi:hypothetical protein
VHAGCRCCEVLGGTRFRRGPCRSKLLLAYEPLQLRKGREIGALRNADDFRLAMQAQAPKKSIAR